MKRKMVFIVQQLSQPRCIKRIETIIGSNPNSRIYGFDNGLYNDNLQGMRFKIEKIFVINNKKSQLLKFCQYILNIRTVLKETKKDDIIYAFGFEIGLIVYLFSKHRYVYEEADIFSSRFSNPLIRGILKWFDEKIIHKSLLTVLTSDGFVEYLFKNKNKPENVVVLPNKLHVKLSQTERIGMPNINEKAIKFAFIGSIRYPDTIFRFAKIVGLHFQQHQFHFFGEGPYSNMAKEMLNEYTNVYFHGSFRNPDDLTDIYSKTDINIVCYDTRSENVNIAEPNKLYESIFYNRPIVVSDGTFLAKRVSQLKVGFSIDCSNDDSIKEFISNLTYEQIKNCIENTSSIDSAELIDNSNSLLNELIRKITNYGN